MFLEERTWGGNEKITSVLFLGPNFAQNKTTTSRIRQGKCYIVRFAETRIKRQALVKEDKNPGPKASSLNPPLPPHSSPAPIKTNGRSLYNRHKIVERHFFNLYYSLGSFQQTIF